MQNNCDLDITFNFFLFLWLTNIFLSRFSKLKIFGFHVFFQFIFMYFMTLVLFLSKFGMYLTYKTGFGPFSLFLGQDINSTVWTRSRSKIEKQVLVFKGLRKQHCKCSSWVDPKSNSEFIFLQAKQGTNLFSLPP